MLSVAESCNNKYIADCTYVYLWIVIMTAYYLCRKSADQYEIRPPNRSQDGTIGDEQNKMDNRDYCYHRNVTGTMSSRVGLVSSFYSSSSTSVYSSCSPSQREFNEPRWPQIASSERRKRRATVVMTHATITPRYLSEDFSSVMPVLRCYARLPAQWRPLC